MRPTAGETFRGWIHGEGEEPSLNFYLDFWIACMRAADRLLIMVVMFPRSSLKPNEALLVACTPVFVLVCVPVYLSAHEQATKRQRLSVSVRHTSIAKVVAQQ